MFGVDGCLAIATSPRIKGWATAQYKNKRATKRAEVLTVEAAKVLEKLVTELPRRSDRIQA
eukprot:2056406-Amphidinium_carterae.1